jgi:hypothetical protein
MPGPGNHSSKKKKTTTTTKTAETTVPENKDAKTNYTASEMLQLVDAARVEGLQEGHKAGRVEMFDEFVANFAEEHGYGLCIPIDKHTHAPSAASPTTVVLQHTGVQASPESAPHTNTSIERVTASVTSVSSLNFREFLTKADPASISQFCDWASTTTDGRNLKLFWQRATDEGKKLGKEEERKSTYGKGYDDGYANGQMDALADKFTFDKHCSEGFSEGLTIGFKNSQLAGREAERKTHEVQTMATTTVGTNHNMQTTATTAEAATQTHTSTKRVDNTSQTGATSHRQSEQAQRTTQTVTNVVDVPNGTNGVQMPPEASQPQPGTTNTTSAPNASANGRRDTEEVEEEREDEGEGIEDGKGEGKGVEERENDAEAMHEHVEDVSPATPTTTVGTDTSNGALSVPAPLGTPQEHPQATTAPQTRNASANGRRNAVEVEEEREEEEVDSGKGKDERGEVKHVENVLTTNNTTAGRAERVERTTWTDTTSKRTNDASNGAGNMSNNGTRSTTAPPTTTMHPARTASANGREGMVEDEKDEGRASRRRKRREEKKRRKYEAAEYGGTATGHKRVEDTL